MLASVMRLRGEEVKAPFVRTEIPIRHGAIAQILAHVYIQTPDDVPHHTVTHDNHLTEPTQDIANLFGGEPAHIAASRHVRRVVTDATAPGHGVEHVLARLT